MSQEFEIDLLRVCKVLWKKAWAIVLCAVVFGGCVLGYSMYTYTPMYAAQTSMYIGSDSEPQFAFSDGDDSIMLNSISEARKLVGSCGAVLKTRSLLEEVINDSGVDRTTAELSNMITSKAMYNTELFKVIVTSKDPEEAAKIANSIAQVLPRKMAMVNCNYDIFQLDSALEPTDPIPSGIGNNVILAVLLGTFFACIIVIVPDILQQYKEHKRAPVAPCQIVSVKNNDDSK